MFKDDSEEKMKRRADLLYPTMKDNKKEKEKKTNNDKKDTGLGVSKYDIEENEDSVNLKNEKNNDWEENLIKKQKELEKLNPKKESREDILYPTMKDKKDNKQGEFTGAAASIETWENDKDFNKVLEYLYPQEGGYSNRKADLGGPTKLGVTQSTYDWYNKRNNIPKQNVKNITKSEATKIYYDYFWKESGAINIEDKGLALMYFDTAVNHGPFYAKKYYKESKGDYNKFMELRKQHYKRMADNIPKQQENYKGWINRLNNMDKYIKKNY